MQLTQASLLTAALLPFLTTATPVPALPDNKLLLKCGGAESVTKNMMAPLVKEILAIPNSNTKTSACRIITCIGNVCAYPTMWGFDWTHVQKAAGLINQLIPIYGDLGCGVGALNGGDVKGGALVFGFIAPPMNQKGKYVANCQDFS